MSIHRISMKQNQDVLSNRLVGEEYVAHHKARGSTECHIFCPLCGQWIHRNQVIVITNKLRIAHLGCWVTAKEAA